MTKMAGIRFSLIELLESLHFLFVLSPWDYVLHLYTKENENQQANLPRMETFTTSLQNMNLLKGSTHNYTLRFFFPLKFRISLLIVLLLHFNCIDFSYSHHSKSKTVLYRNQFKFELGKLKMYDSLNFKYSLFTIIEQNMKQNDASVHTCLLLRTGTNPEKSAKGMKLKVYHISGKTMEFLGVRPYNLTKNRLILW